MSRAKSTILASMAAALGLLGAAPLAQAGIGVPGKHPDRLGMPQRHPQIIGVLRSHSEIIAVLRKSS